jgi:hypothetical protein
MKKILLLIFTIILILSVNVLAVDIDIGTPAIDRASAGNAIYTYINVSNPANASREITSIEIWANVAMTGCEVATFYVVSGTNFSTRATTTIGDVALGHNQFNVNLDVEVGDYIGIYYGVGKLDIDTTGNGFWLKSGDNIPCVNTTFTLTANRTLSLFGAGATVGWSHKWNTITIGKWDTVTFSKWNGLQ